MALNNLLRQPGPPLPESLAKALAATARAFAVPRSHRADLPRAVQDLSRLLTAERGDLSRSYWSASRYLAAYLHYFLPWNLLRLAWLLPGLPLFTDAPQEKELRILDLGSGPLTLPLALWCARPDLRSRPLRFTCSDIAVRPMHIGLAVLRELGGSDLPWKVDLMRGPLFTVLGKSQGTFDCITAGNVLNELPPRRESTLEEEMDALLNRMDRKLAPNGRIFFLEPGTRLGGKLVALAREASLEYSLLPLAPCVHSGPCPMLHQKSYYQASPPYGSWCHFTHPATGAPEALLRLSREARLEKESLSLCCLLVMKPGPDTMGAGPAQDEDTDTHGQTAEAAKDSTPGAARIISQPIRLPREENPARYACTAKGLALVKDAERIPSGGAVEVVWPAPEERDAKTGALMLDRQGKTHVPRAPRSPAPSSKQRHGKPGQAGKKGSPASPLRKDRANRNAPSRRSGSPGVSGRPGKNHNSP